jgi:hypothetical protein
MPTVKVDNANLTPTRQYGEQDTAFWARYNWQHLRSALHQVAAEPRSTARFEVEDP